MLGIVLGLMGCGRSHPLTGEVIITVNEDTNPLEGATVSLNEQIVTTDAAGQAAFSDVPASNYTATAAMAGYENNTAVITVKGGKTATATILLTPLPGNVIITVDDGTNPLEGATVSVGGRSDTTDMLGQVGFDLSAGTYTITASKDGYTENTAGITVTNGGNATATVSLTQQTGNATITVNNGVNPINGASVTLNGQTLTTNGSGQVTFNNVPPGQYTVSATAANYNGDTAQITIAFGTTATATISLTRQTGNISVWVFDHSNFATMGNVIMSGVNVTMNGQTVPTNSYGHADFTNVPTETYTATASYTGFLTNSISVTVTNGRTLDTGYVPGYSYQILLDKPVAGQVLITALRNSGAPLVGATVRITEQSSGLYMTGTTNASGQVTFNSVASGAWTVNITPADYLYPMAFTMNVSETNNTFTFQSIWW